jgi:hypothetical protein
MTRRAYRQVPALGLICAVLAAPMWGPFVQAVSAQVESIQTHGGSYGEWAARWWEWALSIPAAVNPILDTTGANCAQGQVGNVWFLAGTFGGDPVTRACTVPSGKPIFVPLINNIGFAPKGNETVLDLRRLAAGLIDSVTPVTGLQCSLDSSPCAADLFGFRAQSPQFAVIVRPGGLVAPKFYDPMVADGYWLLFSPLSLGPHTLSFRAEANGFVVDVTYNLTVGP